MWAIGKEKKKASAFIVTKQCHPYLQELICLGRLWSLCQNNRDTTYMLLGSEGKTIACGWIGWSLQPTDRRTTNLDNNACRARRTRMRLESGRLTFSGEFTRAVRTTTSGLVLGCNDYQHQNFSVLCELALWVISCRIDVGVAVFLHHPVYLPLKVIGDRRMPLKVIGDRRSASDVHMCVIWGCAMCF